MADFISSIKLNFIDNASPAIKQTRASFSGMKKDLKALGNSSGLVSVAADLSLVSGQVDRFASAILGAVEAPGELQASVEAAMSRVSTVINESNAIAGDVPKTLESIRKEAQVLASGIGPATLGLVEFENSAFSLISSGLSAEQAIAGVTQATLLAQAAGDETAVAVSTLAGVYNNFGDQLADPKVEMAALSDVIARTQQYFAFEDLKQFSDGLSNVAGAAIGFKVPFEQSAAIIGQLNSNMIVGSNAGTAMKSILSQLGNASARLGFDIAKTADGGVDLIATLENIGAAGISGASLTKAFGTEAGPAVGILTEKLLELKGGYDAVLDSSGATFSAAEKMTDNLVAKKEKLNNASQVFNSRIGAGANKIAGFGVEAKLAGMKILNWATGLPVVGESVAGLSGGVMALGGSVVRTAAGFLNMTSGLAASMIMFEKAGPLMGVMRSGLGVMAGGLKTVASGVLGMGKAALMAIPKLFGLAAAHWAVLWPIAAIVLGLAALAAGVIMVVRHWNKIKAFFVNLWEGIKNIFRAAIDWVIGILDNKFVQAALVVIAPFVGVPLAIIKNWDAIKNFFVNLWEGIKNIFRAAIDWVIGILDSKFVQAALVVIAPFVGVPLAIIKNWDAIKNFFVRLWEGIKNIFTAGIDWIRNKLANIPLVGGLFGDERGGLLGGRQGADAVNTMAAGMTDALPAAEEASFSLAKTVDQYMPHSDAKKGPLSRLTESGASMIETIRRGALRRRLDLSAPLGLENNRQGVVSGGDTIINIDALTVQSEDAEDIFRFVRMLKVAGGAA